MKTDHGDCGTQIVDDDDNDGDEDGDGDDEKDDGSRCDAEDKLAIVDRKMSFFKREIGAKLH